jgi:hypothetical protein
MVALLQDKDYDIAINYHYKSFDPIQSAPHLEASQLRIALKAKGLIELNVDDLILPHLISEESAHDYLAVISSLWIA